MSYEMRDFSYREYAKYCKSEGIAPVAYEQYTWEYLKAFCQQHGIKHSIATKEERKEWERQEEQRWANWKPAPPKVRQ